jgi:NADH-quinone oxidoreductase subunit N
VLTSVISVFFYLRVVVMMYMADGPATTPPAPLPMVGMTAVVASVAVIFGLGILPTPVLNYAAQSIATIF